MCRYLPNICAGSSACSRSRPRSRSASAAHLAAMLVQMSSRGPDSAGVAVYRDRAPSGSSKLTLYSADPHERWGAVRDGALRRVRRPARSRRCARATPSSSSTPTRPRPSAGSREHRPDLRVMSAGRVIEIYKEAGLPEEFARAFALEDFRGTHALGHTRMATESRVTTEGVASVLDRARPVPRPQRLALEPQPAAREPAPRGDRVPDGERHRGRRRLPRLAAARGRDRSRRRSRAASTTSTASTPSPSAPPTASRCCATRSRASRRCSPRPTTGSRWPPSGARSRCFPGAADARAWEPEPGRRLRLGEGARLMAVAEREHAAVEVVDLATTPLRELNQRLHDLAGGAPGPRHWRIVNPNGAHAVACGLDAEIEVEIDGHVGYYCAGMNKLATVRVHGNAGTGDRREHDVGPCASSTATRASRPARRAAAASSSSTANASSRCGISMKGIDIVVGGSVGHMSAFMAQTGCLVVCGDAGEALGDSIYEARLYVARLGREPRRGLRREGAARRARRRGARAAGARRRSTPTLASFRRYGSARQLYTFKVDNAARTDVGDRAAPVEPPRVVPLRPHRHRRDPARRDARGSTTSAASARSGGCRTSTTSSSSARASPAIRSRATASAARPTSCSARASRRSRSS